MNRTCKNSSIFRSNILIFRGCILNIGSTTPPTTRITNNFEFGIPKLNLHHLPSSCIFFGVDLVSVDPVYRRMRIFSKEHVWFCPLSTSFTFREQQLQEPQLLISLDWSFSCFQAAGLASCHKCFLKKKTMGKKLNKWCVGRSACVFSFTKMVIFMECFTFGRCLEHWSSWFFFAGSIFIHIAPRFHRSVSLENP